MGAEVPVSDRVLGGRYRLGERLGQGGMAEVFDGYDQRLHRPVAVKLLRPAIALDPEVRDRFEVEARSAARLSHPNVVAVFDTGEDGSTPFIVMERLPGETLADRMAAGPVDQAWLRRVAGDVLGALGAAHGAGLVHRDVKPGNILLGDDGCAKVADFGIAKSLEVAGDLTGTGLLVGTPAYLAPERLDGRPATERSDLYSLGVVLYEALAGGKPFDGATPVAMATAVLNEVPRPLAEVRPDVDPAFATAVERAMAKDPATRPASAAELARLIDGRPPSTPDPTVALAAGAGPDATLVGVPGLVPPAAGTTAGPAARAGAADRAGGQRVGRVPRRLAVMVGAALLAVLVLAALAFAGGSNGGPGQAALAAGIRDLAGRVENGDGPMGPEAGRRLELIADRVEAGGGAVDANALLRDAAQWNGDGRLSGAATTEMAAVLGRIDGVDPSLATTTTTTAAPTTTPPPPPAPSEERDEDRDDDEKGRKSDKGRDD